MLESIALGPYSGLCSLQCVVMNMNRFCVIGLPRRITHHQSIDAWTSNGGIRIAMPCQTTHDMGVHFGQKRGRMAVACQAYPNGPWVRRYTQRWHAHKRLMENRCVESYLVYLRKTNEWATMAEFCFSSNRSRSALAAVMAAVIATAVAAEAHEVCVLFYIGSWRTAPSTIGLDQPSPQGVPVGARDSIRQSTDGSKPNTLAS